MFSILASAFGILLGVLLIELAGRVVLLIRPSYHVLFLEPDRAIGWKHVPNLDWTWAGTHWYAAEFSVPIHSNSHGFRDLERARAKPPGVVRVALLGDSMVEAVQVPLQKTAGQLLERKLEAEAGRSPTAKFEVLNFGISNFGIGQYLLTYETHASDFEPDYVFAYVAPFLIPRTVQKYETGAFTTTRETQLWIRPTFSIRRGALVRAPAGDFEAFVEMQNSVLESDFDGRRMRRRESSVIRRLWHRFRRPGMMSSQGPPTPTGGSDALEINMKVLAELGRRVQRDGGDFAVVDAAVPFMKDSLHVSHAVARLCEREGFGYVPLGKSLMKAIREGRSLHWKHDTHFNEEGNAVVAEALYEWMGQRRVGSTRTQ